MTFQLLNPSTYEFTLLVYIHFFFKLCDPFIFCFMISSLILLSIADDSVLMMWEEMKCWSLQRIKHAYQFELYLQQCTALAMGPFTLISSYFNCLEMKILNSFKLTFEPFLSECCWGNCVDQCHAGSAKPAIGKFIQSHYNQDKILCGLSDCNRENYEWGEYESIQF